MRQREAVIVSAVRTPVGRAGGQFASIPAYKLGGLVLKEAVARIGLDPVEIDDVIFGNLFAFDVANMARMCVLEAGFPREVPGMTVDRQCSSSLNAVMLAAALVMGGFGDVFVAGGAESDSRRPFVLEKPDRPYAMTPPKWCGIQTSPPEIGNPPMGVTAENVAERYHISREEMDEFAFYSHIKAIAAMELGAFDKQIVPVAVPQKKGEPQIITTDEGVRRDITMDNLARLKTVFKADGRVTAGNSSPLSDGASACVVMAREKAETMGLKWLLKFKAYALAGVDPHYMGIGPVPATRKLLVQTGLTLNDIELIELNEAFAAQSLACIKELGLDTGRVNVNGGAIALGHPLAATGGILTAKLAYEMADRGCRYGMVSFCCGGGQGVAALFEGPER